MNTIILSMQKYPRSDFEDRLFEGFNLFFTIVFILEMLIKLLGLGFSLYFKDIYNRFDCFTVLASIVDIILTDFVKLSPGDFLQTVKALRILRIFKLTKSWENFRNLLSTIFNTLRAMRSMAILLVFFMFFFAILGMEFFAF